MSEEYIEEGINGQWTDWKFEAKNYKKIYEHLYQENQQLKERIEYLERSIARKEDTIEGYIHETVELDKYKEVIDEVREYVNNHIHQETFTGYMDSYELKKLLQILDKTKEKEH